MEAISSLKPREPARYKCTATVMGVSKLSVVTAAGNQFTLCYSAELIPLLCHWLLSVARGLLLLVICTRFYVSFTTV